MAECRGCDSFCDLLCNFVATTLKKGVNMAIKVGINGFGRIGRLFFRRACLDKEIQVVGINDIADIKPIAHLLKYDTIYGKFPGTISIDGDYLLVNNSKIRVISEKEPSNLPWRELGVDIVIESTGIFRTREKAAKHLTAGAKKVIISAPAKSEVDATIVYGVNNDVLKPEHKIISNASCTTNCLAPVVKVLNDNFCIESAVMTTVHSYTADQNILDGPHRDLRRARAAAVNMVPTTTGAAIATTKVIPELQGKINGMALRVPTPDGSLVDLCANVKKDVTPKEINAVMKNACDTYMKGIIEYSEEPLVLSDIVGNVHSGIFDALSTMVVQKRLIKVIAWYDNEIGYASRIVDVIKLMNKL